jgi:hypothetical protein
MEDGSVHDSEQSAEAVPDSTPSSAPEIPSSPAPDSDYFEVAPPDTIAGAGLTEELRGLSEALEQSAGEVPSRAAAPADSFAAVVARAVADVGGVPDSASEAASAEGASDAGATPEVEEQGVAVEAAIAASLDDIAPGTIATAEATEAENGASGAETVESADAESAESAQGVAEAAGETEAAGDTEQVAEGIEPDEAETAEAVAAAEPTEPTEQPTADLGVVAPRTRVWSWPFVAYVVLWLGGAGYLVWQFEKLPAGQAVYETKLYSLSMLVGLGLLAFGPALTLVIWIAQWIASRKSVRVGSIFISALVKGASVTLLGAVIWIAALLLTDYLRFGRLF